MRDVPMTLLRKGDLLLNGLACALLVTRDGRGHAGRAWLLRKRDNRALAGVMPVRDGGVMRTDRRRLSREEGGELRTLLKQLRQIDRIAPPPPPGQAGHVARLQRQLGVDADMLAGYRPPSSVEPGQLLMSGRDIHARPLWLEPASAGAWRRLRAAAAAGGIALHAVSGYRSADYQAALVARKLARGQSLDEILRVSALPGHSEHHLGTTLDLHDGDGPALEETFGESAAFEWLRCHARAFGFVLSYPRDNPWGIAYEPWHWRYIGAGRQGEPHA